MTSDSTEQYAQSILTRARKLPASERKRYLREMSSELPFLAEWIELLEDDSATLYRSDASHLDPGSDSSQTKIGVAESTDFEVSEPDDTVEIPGYTLLEQLGEGGMGAVYVAQQTEPVRRKVALKIIRTGFASKETRARFAAERQALALMDHPNIARIYAGGTTSSGDPYLVMELVQGLPITQYAKIHQLDINNRLRLMISVCQAVQHAHQKGVIHRDLKPSNILVAEIDGKAVPKVIDFGLAKAIRQDLTDQTLYTKFAQMIGTPLYMSPEQAAMGVVDVDTRSDVYSIGVLMYELLTGRTPFDRTILKKASFDEMRRIIREEEPKRPSTAISTLRGDKLTTAAAERQLDPRRLKDSLRGEIDWVVMRALEKDRSRRYESPGELARDIERFLANEPVAAGPPSAVYRLRKMASRHKVLLTTASLVLLSIIVALLVSLDRARIANEALAFADARLIEEQKARRVASTQRDAAKRERRRSAQLLYVADMKLASDALAAGDIPRLTDLLDRHVPEDGVEDLRNFVWHYLHDAIDVPQHWSLELGSRIRTIAVSPDSRIAAIGTADGSLSFVDCSTGHLLGKVSTDEILSAAWSSDGARLATGHRDGEVHIFQINGEKLRLRQVHLTNGHHGPSLDEAIIERHCFDAHTDAVPALAFIPDSDHLISGGEDSVIRIHNASDGELLDELNDHDKTVEQLAISPDGTKMISASSDQHLFLWDLKKREPVQRVRSPISARMVTAAFSDDGRYLAAGDIRGHVLVADTEMWRYRWINNPDGIEAVAFLPNQPVMVAGDRGGSIHSWSVVDQLESDDTLPGQLSEFEPQSLSVWQADQCRIENVAVIAEMPAILSGSRDGSLVCWAPRIRSDPTWPARNIAVGHDGTLITCDQSIQLWDRSLDRPLHTFDLPPHPWRHLAAATNSPHFVVTGDDGTVCVFDIESRQLVHQFATEPPYSEVAISPDGLRIAVRNRVKDRVQLFEIGKSEAIWDRRIIQCSCLAFSPDGHQLAVGGLDDLHIYDLDRDVEPIDLQGHDSTVEAARFHPTDPVIASVGSDRRLKLWDLPSATEISSANASQSPVIVTLDFSSDGELIATGGQDGVVRLWHTETLQPMLEIERRGSIRELEFSFDNSRLIAIFERREFQAVVFDSGQPGP